MTAPEPVEAPRGERLDVAGLTCPRCTHPRLAHWTPGKSTTACVVCLEGQIRTADLNDSTRVGFCCIPAEQITPSPPLSGPVESREQPSAWVCDEPNHLPIGWFRDRIEEQTQLAIRFNLDRGNAAMDHRAEQAEAAATIRELRAEVETWKLRADRSSGAWLDLCLRLKDTEAERDRARSLAAGLAASIEALADEVADSQRLADFDGVVKMRPGIIASRIRALAAHLEAELAETRDTLKRPDLGMH